MTMPKTFLLLLCLVWTATSFSPSTTPAPPRLASFVSAPNAVSIRQRSPKQSLTALCMSSEAHNDKQDPDAEEESLVTPPPSSPLSFWKSLWTSLRSDYTKAAQVDDFEVLLFDILLLLNLVVSISFWVVHRMELDWIALALSEGCLLSLCWLGAGLSTGAFLYSAVDGHYRSGDDRGGPVAAAKLAFHTYVNAINIRLVVALVVAVSQHRPVGSVGGESLLPLELGLGLVLMPLWRMLHSSYLPRL